MLARGGEGAREVRLLQDVVAVEARRVMTAQDHFAVAKIPGLGQMHEQLHGRSHALIRDELVFLQQQHVSNIHM